jgi:hypothetical protein
VPGKAPLPLENFKLLLDLSLFFSLGKLFLSIGANLYNPACCLFI